MFHLIVSCEIEDAEVSTIFQCWNSTVQHDKYVFPKIENVLDSILAWYVNTDQSEVPTKDRNLPAVKLSCKTKVFRSLQCNCATSTWHASFIAVKAVSRNNN